MEWTLIDRANRSSLILVLLVIVAASTPILLGSSYLPLMAVVAVSFVSAWRLSLARSVKVAIDQDGIVKTLGAKSWRLNWGQISSVSFTRFFGTDQMVVAGGPRLPWSGSDRLYNVVPDGSRAVQVPAQHLAELRQLLAARGLLEP